MKDCGLIRLGILGILCRRKEVGKAEDKYVIIHRPGHGHTIFLTL